MENQVVYHPRYGRGVVKKQRHRGLGLYVAFENGQRCWVQVTELLLPSSPPAKKEPAQITDTRKQPPPNSPQRKTIAAVKQPLSSSPPREAVTAPKQPRPSSSPPKTLVAPTQSPSVIESIPEQRTTKSTFHSRCIIEAFRMGIVPDDCVASLTVGRDQEIASLQQWIEQDKGSALLIGEYGSGKSHLLRYLYLQAMKQRFVVAQVQIDPNETPLHKPKRIYRNVALTLQYRLPDHPTPLGFKDLVRAGLQDKTLLDHEYFGYLANKVTSDAWYEDMVWEWIQASEDAPKPGWGYLYNYFSYLPPIYNHTTSANIICYLLSGLAWAAVQSLGLRGIIIFIDEAESMDVNASRSQLERGINFLQGLIRVTNGDKKLLKEPQYSGLVHSGVSIGPRIPFLYKQDCGLRAVFGFAPTPLLDEIPELRSTPRVNLEPLSKNFLATVFRWVRQHYERAYAIEISDAEVGQSLDTLLRKSENTRAFVKGCVEILDYQRYNSISS